MSRFTHIRWKDCEPGTILAGRLLPLRSFPSKSGTSTVLLGEVEHTDGRRTGFTVPTVLRTQLEQIPVGSEVRITYRGTRLTGAGRALMQFVTVGLIGATR